MTGTRPRTSAAPIPGPCRECHHVNHGRCTWPPCWCAQCHAGEIREEARRQAAHGDGGPVRDALLGMISLDAQRQARAERINRKGPRQVGYCGWCGAPIFTRLGRPRRWCGPTHRKYGYLARRAAREQAAA